MIFDQAGGGAPLSSTPASPCGHLVQIFIHTTRPISSHAHPHPSAIYTPGAPPPLGRGLRPCHARGPGQLGPGRHLRILIDSFHHSRHARTPQSPPPPRTHPTTHAVSTFSRHGATGRAALGGGGRSMLAGKRSFRSVLASPSHDGVFLIHLATPPPPLPSHGHGRCPKWA